MVQEKQNYMEATEATKKMSERIGTTDYPHWQFEQPSSRTENNNKDDKFPRMVAGYATELVKEADNGTNTEQADIMDDFLDEARYNLATRVMSNGVEVIIASDKSKTPLAGADVVTEIATKDAPQQLQHHQLQLRVVPSQAIYRPMTLAASTLKNQMILVMPSLNVEPINFSIPADLNQFVTKICLTTYTYRTTYLQDGSTTVESQEQVISNIATEERNYFRMTPAMSLGVTLTQTPSLAIGVFPTTYSYYNTILDADVPLVQTSKRTIINTITGPHDYIHFLQPSEEATPAHETNTYYSKLAFTNILHDAGVEKIMTTTHTLTQVIVTESLPPRGTTLLSTKGEYFGADSAPNISKDTPTLTTNHKAEVAEQLAENSLHTEYDIHIYTAKTFVTTFTYFKTSLLSASDNEGAGTPSKKLAMTGLGGQAATAVFNYHTRFIENVITETVPNSLINSDLVSKFHTELKKGKNERRVIVTTASLLGGQTLEITAMRVFKPAPKTVSVSSETFREPTKAAIRPAIDSTVDFTKLNKKISKFTKPNHNIMSTAAMKRTKVAATIATYTTKAPIVSVTTARPLATTANHQPESVLANETSFDESDANNIDDIHDADSLTADSEYDAVYVSKSPTLKKPVSPHKQQQIDNINITNNKNRIPVAVNQIIGSLNFQRLTALRPVFNAMAGLLQSNFASTLGQKNVSGLHDEQLQLQHVATSPVPVSVFSVPNATDGVSVLKLDNSADTESRHHIESSTTKQPDKPIYIPVKDADFAVDGRRPQSATTAVGYTGDLLDMSSGQSLHIQPPQADVIISDDEDSWLLQRTANDIYPQQLANQQTSPQQQLPEYQSLIKLKNRNQNLQGESLPARLLSDKNGFETSLINGGIPIRPGEVITANSDVIIGKPNGIQYPLMPVPKRNVLASTNLIPTRQNAPPAKPVQQQMQAYLDKSPLNSQLSSIPLLDMQQPSFVPADYHRQQQQQQASGYPHPHNHMPLHAKEQHHQQHQQIQNHFAQIVHLPQENYDNILRPPPMVSTNAYTAYAQTLGMLSPPALFTSPPLSVSRVQSIQKPSHHQDQYLPQFASSTAAPYAATSQLNTFTYEPQLNEIRAGIHKPTIFYPTNYSETDTFGDEIIGFNKVPNLYDVMVYTQPQSVNYFQNHSKTPQHTIVGNVPPEFSSYSYSALNATYDTVRGAEPPLRNHIPVGSPSNHQHINLHTHVFSHNVNVNAPPLTFKKETDYPTHASAVHGQIPSNVAATGQRLPFTIVNMPHVKIPHNEKQVEVNLTPQNVIGQISKPNAHTKGPSGAYVANPPTTYNSENLAGSAVIGSFSLDNGLKGFLETQQSQSHSNTSPPKLAAKAKQNYNYSQMYVMTHTDSANLIDGANEVNVFHRMHIPPGSSATAAASGQTAVTDRNQAAPAQSSTHALLLPPPAVTNLESDWPSYGVQQQANPDPSNSNMFMAPAIQMVDADVNSANAAVDLKTGTGYYDHDSTINEVENSSILDQYEEAVKKLAGQNSTKHNNKLNVDAVDHSDTDVHADQSTASATNSLHEQIKTKQQQLILSHSTLPQELHVQEWQQKNNQQQVLHPFLSPNAALEVNGLHGVYYQSPALMPPPVNDKRITSSAASSSQKTANKLRSTADYISDGAELDSYMNLPTTTPTNMRQVLKSRPLHSQLLLRGVPFTIENSLKLKTHTKEQTSTQAVYVAKGDGFKRPKIGAEEILVALGDNFSHKSAPTHTPYVHNDQKHKNTKSTATTSSKMNNYTRNAAISQTTSTLMAAKLSTPRSVIQTETNTPTVKPSPNSSQRLQFLNGSATQPPATETTFKVAHLNSKASENTPTAATPTRKNQHITHAQPFNEVYASYEIKNLESTPAGLEEVADDNVYHKPTTRMNQPLPFSNDVHLQQPGATGMEKIISNGNAATFGYKQSHTQNVVGLSPPPLPTPPKQIPRPILLAPMQMEILYTTGNSNSNTHAYNTINFKTMWQAPLQPPVPQPSESIGHEISYIPRTTDDKPLQQPKPIPLTTPAILRNTAMRIGVSSKSKLMPTATTTRDTKYYNDKLIQSATSILNTSRSETSEIATPSSKSLTKYANILKSDKELAKHVNTNTEKTLQSQTDRPSVVTKQLPQQSPNNEKIEAKTPNHAKNNPASKVSNHQQPKLYPKPLLDSSESISVVTSNSMTPDSSAHTIAKSNDSSIDEVLSSKGRDSFAQVSNVRQRQRQQEQQQQQQQQRKNRPQNLSPVNGYVLLPTKYITRTQLLTVTTTRSTVILTTATEPLQGKFFMVTRTQTATVVNTITHTEWATETETETETETATAVATKPKTKSEIRTLVQPTRITESHIIFATTTTTKIETETIAPEKSLVGEMSPTSVLAEDIDSYTKIPYIDMYSNHRLQEFGKPQFKQEHFSYDANNNKNNDGQAILGQVTVEEENTVDMSSKRPVHATQNPMENEAISNETGQIPPNNSIFIVMRNSQNGGKAKPANDIAESTLGGSVSGSGVDANGATIELYYDDSLAVFNLPTRDEESYAMQHDLQQVPNQVLLGGVIIASPPKLLDAYGTAEEAEKAAATCTPSCKLARSEVCARADRHWRCACRPGFARMFPDRPCKPTYTYAMRIQTDRIGNYELLYDRTLGNNSTDEYKQLATITKGAVDRMVMQSDFRDIYHGVQLTTFQPIEENSSASDDKNPHKQAVAASFLLQLSENSDEKRLVGVFKKYLRLSNYSIGGTELFTNRNGVESLAIMDFDECAHAQFHDCSPNARCFNLQGTYTCSCKEGFVDLSGNAIYPGRLCSAELVGCDQCNYHGKCTVSKVGLANAAENTVCECFAWYTGARCQVNLKIFLIVLIAVGTLLLMLLMFCILLVCTKRHSIRHRARPLSPSSTSIRRIITAKNSALAGIGFIGGSSAHGISDGRSRSVNPDKCAMIKDTSSESSQNSLPYLLQKESTMNSKKAHHRSRHPDTTIDSSGPAGEQRHSTYGRLPPTDAINTNTNGSGKYVSNKQSSFMDLERNYPDQSDRSLTVMIPRAKYHASVLPQTQLFHQQVMMEHSKKQHEQQRMQQKQHQVNKSDNTTTSMSVMQDNICGILQHQKKIAKITSKNLNIGGSKYSAPISVAGLMDSDCGLANMNLHQSGALVSAGFEVSAIVGENILITDTNNASRQLSTRPNDNNFDAIVVGMDTSGDDSAGAITEACNTDDIKTMKGYYQTTQSFSEQQQQRQQQQQLEQAKVIKQFLHRSIGDRAHSDSSTMQGSVEEILNAGHTVTYECENESAVAHSIEETTIQAVMKPMHICFDTQTANTNDEANTMAERDVGSTFLLPHTHLYKTDVQGSDISGFESF